VGADVGAGQKQVGVDNLSQETANGSNEERFLLRASQKRRFTADVF
jgi:hypothetical protein